MQHVQDVSLRQVALLLKLYIVLQPISTMAVAVARVSVAVLMLRLLGPSIWRKRFLYFIIVSTLLLGSIYSILVFFQCSPISSFWEFGVRGYCSYGFQEAVVILASVTSGTCIFLYFKDYIILTGHRLERHYGYLSCSYTNLDVLEVADEGQEESGLVCTNGLWCDVNVSPRVKTKYYPLTFVSPCQSFNSCGSQSLEVH